MKMRITKSVFLLITLLSFSLIFTIGCKKKTTTTEYAVVLSVQAIYSNGEITINWTAPQNATPTKYKLYKNNELIQTLTTTSYIDVIMVANTYKYAVVAVYADGESEKTYSNEVVVSEDNTTQIAGNYLGKIGIAPINGNQIDTLRDVSIALEKINTTTISIQLEESIYIPTMAMHVPLSIDEQVTVSKNGEKYTFTINSTVTVNPFPQPVPIVVNGVVAGDILTLSISVNLGPTTVSANYIGAKQE